MFLPRLEVKPARAGKPHVEHGTAPVERARAPQNSSADAETSPAKPERLRPTIASRTVTTTQIGFTGIAWVMPTNLGTGRGTCHARPR
jgi:hypothetical protein